MDSELLAMMPDTLTWAPLATIDGRQRRTFGTAVPVPGQWDKRHSQHVDHNGNIQATSGRYICGGVFAINESDLVTMGDGTTPKIISVDTIPDENGPYVTIVTFGV